MRSRLLDEDSVLRTPWSVGLLVAVAAGVGLTGSMGALVIFVGVTVSIAVHEGAHLLVARACRVRVDQFFVGFGPRLWQRRIRDTEVSLRLVPFAGGAIHLHDDDEPTVRHRSWLLIAAAGPLANLVLGWVLLMGASALVDGTGATEAAVVATDQATLMVTLTAETVVRLPELIGGNLSAATGGEPPAPESRVLSPVSMAQIGNGAAAAGGLGLLIRIIAVINIGLGIMNLLPVPPLDGSLIAMHVFEGVGSKLARRPIQFPKLVFRSAAYAFTGVILLTMVAGAIVDLTAPVDAFG